MKSRSFCGSEIKEVQQNDHFETGLTEAKLLSGCRKRLDNKKVPAFSKMV